MNDKEIEKIQRYIYKNPYSKTGEELIQYIKLVIILSVTFHKHFTT
ncbi:hypothetical protein [Clostridium tarantellae]|nr:hypothetical protein [Clostridium tarantellae]